MIATSAYHQAERWIGTREIPGKLSSPAIMAMLTLDTEWPKDDEVPWCSAFANYICWELRLPRSKSLVARSWLGVGRPIHTREAVADCDVVIFKNAGGPGPDVLEAPGHVAFFSRLDPADERRIWVLGGNQSNSVSVMPASANLVIGVRRLQPDHMISRTSSPA